MPVAINHETNEIIRNPKTGFANRNSYHQGGEILVKLTNESLFPGYWNNIEATKKKFDRNVFKQGDLYYRSGDALRRTEDGRWFFMDRLGDTYRWKSENISTAEVAEVIGKYPGIFEANVYGVEVPRHEGRSGCAALTIAPERRKNFDWMYFAPDSVVHFSVLKLGENQKCRPCETSFSFTPFLFGQMHCLHDLFDSEISKRNDKFAT